MIQQIGAYSIFIIVVNYKNRIGLIGK